MDEPLHDVFPDRAILHIDMDAFFASVEVLDDPALKGLPVLVGGRAEGRGVIAAASYEARRYGIHSAMSTRQALQRCPHAVLLPPRRERYCEISHQIFTIFGDYTPLVEPISIDEAFLDVTASRGLFGTAEQIGRRIKKRIADEIGLTASVGLAPNKFLAKLASDLEKPNGFVVLTVEEAARRLPGLPVGRLWGVGPKTQTILAQMGLLKIGDLLDCSLDLLRAHLGDGGAQTLLALARGQDDRPVQTDSLTKSISAETTFPRDIADAVQLRRELDALTDEVAQRLRREGYVTRTVSLKARYPDFTTVTRAMTLDRASSETVTLRRIARELLERRLGRAGRPLRLVGVAASNLERAGEGQLDLFDDPRRERSGRLDTLMDKLQERFGPDSIGRGRP